MNRTESFHYDPNKDLIHIPGKISGPLGEQNLRFAFDPGSYLTIVNTCLIDSLGYQAAEGDRRVSTGSVIGKEWGYTLTVKKLAILGFEFDDYKIACFDLPEQYGIDGLIGLDMLERFEVTLRHKERWIQFCLL